MKKSLWILLPLVLTAGRAWCQDLLPSQKWFEQIDGGAVVPASAEVSRDYGVGLGGDVLMGYRFNRDFSLAADLGYFYSGQSTTGVTAGGWAYAPAMVLLRYNMGSGWIRPYLLAGAGFALNSYSIAVGSSAPSNSEVNFLFSSGFGISFILEQGFALYFQTRLDMDLTPASTELPLSDSPTLFIPVKIGMTFESL
jgi:opacity protein-like surface antigen